MTARRSALARLTQTGIPAILAAILLLCPRSATANPVFARKYHTGCQTCHTVFPRLNPFGEAFRTNGYRFPEEDEAMARSPVVSMGSEAWRRIFPGAIWPSGISAAVPLAVGVSGEVLADDAGAVSFAHLVDEVEIWGAGSFDPHVTFLGEVAVDGDGVEIEAATVHFNDLVGPAHALNLVVGRGWATISGVGAQSSLLAGSMVPRVHATELFGGDPQLAWAFGGDSNLVELNGLVAGRLAWSVAVGQSVGQIERGPQEVYVHIGGKVGGMRLDGEGGDPGELLLPSGERAVLLDIAGARSSSEAIGGGVDSAWVGAITMRASGPAAVLDVGLVDEAHDSIDGQGARAAVITAFGEVAISALPWLTPVARLEYTEVHQAGAAPVRDIRLTPGVALLVRANCKLTLGASLEQAHGAPPAGWTGAGGAADPDPSDADTGVEFERAHLSLFYAY